MTENKVESTAVVWAISRLYSRTHKPKKKYVFYNNKRLKNVLRAQYSQPAQFMLMLFTCSKPDDKHATNSLSNKNIRNGPTVQSHPCPSVTPGTVLIQPDTSILGQDCQTTTQHVRKLFRVSMS